MKPLPLPVRVAAGLAVTAVDRARHLPEKLAELPVTMVSQALQLSMRVQQQVTELAIKGDDALSTLRPVEESPEWATFDEDAAEGDYDASADANDTRSRFDAAADEDTDTDAYTVTDADADNDADTEAIDDHSGDPWAAEEQAMVHELHHEDAGGPAALPDYPELTLPQVRARMRRLGIDQLTELVEFERAHSDRPAFVGMLTRRIGTLRDQR